MQNLRCVIGIMLTAFVSPAFAEGLGESAQPARAMTKDGMPITFSCALPRNSKTNPMVKRFTLTLVKDAAWIQHEGAPRPIPGKANPKYKPRTNVNFFQYVGFEGYISDPQSPRPSLLVERALLGGGIPLRNGRFGGAVKVQDSFGGMWIENFYFCQR